MEEKETSGIPGNDETEGDPLSMMIEIAKGIEDRLSASLGKAIEAIDKKAEQSAQGAAAIQSQAKVALEAMPAMIKENIEAQLSANLESIVEQVGTQVEGKIKEMVGGGGGANGGGGSGLSLEKLLANSDKIVNVVNAFRSPTTDQAMMSQMNFVMKWHSLLSKLEKGGGSGEEFTKAIASTFTEKQE